MNKMSVKPLSAWINQFMLPCYDAHKTTNVLLWHLDVKLNVVNFILKITDDQIKYSTWTEWWDQNTSTTVQVRAGRLRKWQGREKKRKMDMNVDVLHLPTCDWMPGPETHWHSDSIDLFPTAVCIIKISASTLSPKCFWPFPSVARPLRLWSAVIRRVYTAFHHSSPVWQHTMMWFRGKEESTLSLTLMASIDPVSKYINGYGKTNHARWPCLGMRNINSNISSNINSTWSFEKGK